MAESPNIGLQRTSACGLAAEAGSFARVSMVTAVLVGVGIVLTVRSAVACDCFEPSDLKSAVSSADAVFVGEVVSIDVKDNGYSNPPQIVRFKATEAWKGVRSPDVTVSTGGVWDCEEFAFEAGKRYLVFAKRSREGLSTAQCMGNFWVWRDYELRDIRKLRSGKKLTK
jgi:hypothetical protein